MENPFKNLKIKNHYTYLLVLAGVILLINLFSESKIISQGKLALLCIITVIYGLVEWIRENHFNEKIAQLNIIYNNYWQDESNKKNINDIYNKNWEEQTRKKFEADHNMKNLLPDYQRNTWIFFVTYLIIISFFIYRFYTKTC